MKSECQRIAEQLRRAFAGQAWHGPSLLGLLGGVGPEQACARPIGSAHNIWELMLHIDFWVHAALQATEGVAMPRMDGSGTDWPSPGSAEALAWFDAQDGLFGNAEKLAQAIEQFGDARLQDTVSGRDYDFYHLFHGIVQHSLYHGGQIAILRKAFSDV
jgi:hypothetical protein